MRDTGLPLGLILFRISRFFAASFVSAVVSRGLISAINTSPHVSDFLAGVRTSGRGSCELGHG